MAEICWVHALSTLTVSYWWSFYDLFPLFLLSLGDAVWDLNMPREPLEIYQVHEHFRRNFVALYENDSIFDKFECAWSPDNQ